MNVTGILSHGVIKQIIDQLYNRRLAGYLLKIAYILRDIFYQRKIFQSLIVDDIINDKDIGRRQICLQGGLDILGRRTDYLNLTAAYTLYFVHQKHICRLAHRHRKPISNLKQRQNDMFFEKFPRQNLKRLCVTYFWTNLRIRHAVRLRKRRGYLILRTVIHLDQKLAEQSAMALLFLFSQSFFNLLSRHNTARQQQLPKLHFVFHRYLTHRFSR